MFWGVRNSFLGLFSKYLLKVMGYSTNLGFQRYLNTTVTSLYFYTNINVTN